MSEPLIEITPVDPRSPEAAELIRALSEELARRYDFVTDGTGNFKPEDALVARSAFGIGRVGGRAVACGAFRPLEDRVAEIMRMFVAPEPEHRGRGYSKAILVELERLARGKGCTTVRLETGYRQVARLLITITLGTQHEGLFREVAELTKRLGKPPEQSQVVALASNKHLLTNRKEHAHAVE